MVTRALQRCRAAGEQHGEVFLTRTKTNSRKKSTENARKAERKKEARMGAIKYSVN
jgi:hypothetical protein